MNAIVDLIERSLGDFKQMGGSGSGHRGHKGVKGQKGGSAPSVGSGIGPNNFDSAASQFGVQAVFNKSAKYKRDGGAYSLRDKDGKNWGYVVKDRESGDWKLEVDRIDYEWSETEKKTLRHVTAEFAINLGRQSGAEAALKEVTNRYGVGEKVTRQTQFRTEKAIPSHIDISDWNGSNYKRKFEEATGHKLGNGVDVPQAKTLAEALQGLPQTGKKITIQTYRSEVEYRKAYFGKDTTKFTRAYAFYKPSKHTGGGLHFSPRCSTAIQIGKDQKTIRHEYGHAVDNTLRTGGYKYRSDLSKATKLFTKAKASGRLPRAYSGTNSKEFFADSFALVAKSSLDGTIGDVKSNFLESHDVVGFVLGDRMPEAWK